MSPADDHTEPRDPAASGQSPDDGQMPADWLQHEPPEVSPDFVERTLARILADRADRTAAGDTAAGSTAASVDESLPLATYGVPAPSADFVDRTMAALQTDRELDKEMMAAIRRHDPAPAPSTDFVDRTLAAIKADGSAAGDVEIPRDLLAEYRTPTPRADFVDRTLAAIEADESARGSREFPSELLGAYSTPEPSHDFVSRTLIAIEAERQPTTPAAKGPRGVLKGGATERPAESAETRRRWVPMLALAAAALFAVTLFWTQGEPPAPTDPGNDGPVALETDILWPSVDELERALSGTDGPVRPAAQVVGDPTLQPMPLQDILSAPFADRFGEGRLQEVQPSGMTLMAEPGESR